MSPKMPSASAIAEAKKNPGGWVYEIGGGLDPNGAIPPDAILGAWQVDDTGKIVGQFKVNPNYDAKKYLASYLSCPMAAFRPIRSLHEAGACGAKSPKADTQIITHEQSTKYGIGDAWRRLVALQASMLDRCDMDKVAAAFAFIGALVALYEHEPRFAAIAFAFGVFMILTSRRRRKFD